MKLFLIMLFLLPVATFGQELVDVKTELVDEINALRRKRLAHPLEYREKYQASCDAFVKGLPRSFKHSSARGEVIALTGYTTDDIVQQFMDSPGHKAALMNRRGRGICLSVYMLPAKAVETKNSVITYADRYYTVIRIYE